jgi:hypothetical protein
MAFVGPLEAKKLRVKQKPVYMVGVGTSLLDSMVFMSDMHLVDSVSIQSKKNFLMDRQLYSFQLQRYLEAAYKGGPYITAIYFSPNRKRMERRYLSLHKRYANRKELHLILVDQSQFRFKAEKFIDDAIVTGE